MTAWPAKEFEKVFLQLEKFGLLLLSDSSLPNVAALVAGEKVSGSWWSHKAAQRIFVVSEALEDHADVLILKLVSNKVTFVHRELWGRVYSIGVARDDWQLKKLSPVAKQLLKALDDHTVPSFADQLLALPQDDETFPQIELEPRAARF